MSVGLGPHLRLVSHGVLSHWCPACDRAHLINLSPRAAEWDHNGAKPTFTPDIKHVDDEAVCHYRIDSGQIRFLPDCTHIFAGRTVALPVFPHHRAG